MVRHRPGFPAAPDPFSNERGSMLVLALIVVLLMTVLVSDITDVSMVEYEASVNVGKLTRMDYALNAGFEVAKANLLQDDMDTDVDSLNDLWAQPLKEEIGGESAESVRERSLDQPPPNVTVSIEIEDEESKWPLPLAILGNDAQLRRRRELLGAVIQAYRENWGSWAIDSGTADRIAEQIISFLKRKENDAGIVPRPSTKSEIHILNTADLTLIPGIDDHIFYDAVTEKGDVVPGLLRFITIWSYDLKINVNTAPLPVLRGLFRNDDRGRADDIYHHRTAQSEDKEKDRNSTEGRLEERKKDKGKDGQQQDEDRAGGAIFEKPADVSKIEGMSQRVFAEAGQMMSVGSKTFSIWVTAELGAMSRTRHWVVRRENGRIVQILCESIDPDYRPRFRKLGPDEEEGREPGIPRLR